MTVKKVGEKSSENGELRWGCLGIIQGDPRPASPRHSRQRFSRPPPESRGGECSPYSTRVGYFFNFISSVKKLHARYESDHRFTAEESHSVSGLVFFLKAWGDRTGPWVMSPSIDRTGVGGVARRARKQWEWNKPSEKEIKQIWNVNKLKRCGQQRSCSLCFKFLLMKEFILYLFFLSWSCKLVLRAWK